MNIFNDHFPQSAAYYNFILASPTRKEWPLLWGEYGSPGTQDKGHQQHSEPQMECLDAVLYQRCWYGRPVYHSVWSRPLLPKWYAVVSESSKLKLIQNSFHTFYQNLILFIIDIYRSVLFQMFSKVGLCENFASDTSFSMHSTACLALCTLTELCCGYLPVAMAAKYPL